MKEEYLHKAAMVSSYISFKTQLGKTHADDKDLMKKLMETNIEAISLNPAETLDKAKGEKSETLAEKLIDVVEDIKDRIEKIGKTKTKDEP